MENIIGLFGVAGVLALVCIGIVALLYPIMFEISFREHIGTIKYYFPQSGKNF